MAKNFTVCMGTLGTGIWQSPDGGETWRRSRLGDGYQLGRSVYDVAVDPRDSSAIYAAADDGVYLSRDRGVNFDKLGFPGESLRFWRVLVDPIDPDTLFAGTCPAGVYRSRDRGEHWEKVCSDFADECANVGAPRLTALAIDPADHGVIWAGAEVDGVRLSLDGGDTWARVAGAPLDDPDIHDIIVVPGEPPRVFVTMPGEICVSEDRGDNWTAVGIGGRFSQPYCRSMTVKPDDPRVVFAGTGSAPQGEAGAVQRSTDGGQTWEAPRLPVVPNSYITAFATHPANPDLVLAASHFGQIFASGDGGEWWVKLPKEGSEIRGGLAWIPN